MYLNQAITPAGVVPCVTTLLGDSPFSRDPNPCDFRFHDVPIFGSARIII